MISQSVAVPEETCAAYVVPADGSDLQLTITKGSGVKKILSADTSLQDASDSVQWLRDSPAENGPADQYVFKIGAVRSSQEYVSIHGTFQREGGGGDGGTSTPSTFDVDVPGVDIDIDGVTEENEETTGGCIAWNGDDDNHNQTPDKEESGAVAGENDLLKITIGKVEPSTRLTGTVTLSASAGGEKIKLWTSATKEAPVTLPKTYATPSELPKDLWVEGVAASGAERDVELKVSYTNKGKTTEDKVKLTVAKADLDIRETAQPQNRVGRDDPRVLARVRNRILIWANSGGKTIAFDLIKPPDITSPVWVQIEDLKGVNSSLPHFERLDAASKAFIYTVADDNDAADLLVSYGADLNSDGMLSGTDEIKGTYEVYGVTAEEYAESRNNYNWFYLPGALYDLADQLHKRFASGAFGSGDFRPTTTSNSATLSATRLTHYFGVNLTDAGFVTRGSRQYYAATATFPIYHYADNSDASELIRESPQLKDGLDAFVASLSHATVAAAYASAPGGATRSVTFSLDGRTFQFGATGSIGLGGVGIHSAEPYSGAGTIMLQITRNGGSYEISADATTDLTLHDIFDFDYFTTGWMAGFSDSSQSAAMIQNGFGKTGSVTNAGQIGLVEIEVDGSVTITGRVVTP